MSKDIQTICCWSSSDLKAKNILTVVNEPRFFCEECGRVANKKKWLCLPQKLPKNSKKKL